MERKVHDIPQLYSEMVYLLNTQGKEENSRNGRVISLQEPLLVTVATPRNRVLYDPIRDANPFFHLMEFVWMMSGSNEPNWIKQFNARFEEYADPSGVIHGAYGHRWRNHFDNDQLHTAIRILRNNPESRRVVLGMWDPSEDLGTEHNDLPCNTHIYLRIVDGSLNMTVSNRSNDVIWGMSGANAVHMTMLQELIAQAVDVEVGTYSVMTVNAHMYPDLVKDFERIRMTTLAYYPEGYSANDHITPILADGEHYTELLHECFMFVRGRLTDGSAFLAGTAAPMEDIYLSRKGGHVSTEQAIEMCEDIHDIRWRNACIQWLRRRLK